MLEAKWEIDSENGRGWEYTGNSPSLFYEYKTNVFEQKLALFLQSEKRFNGEIFEFTLRQRYLPKHTNDIFKNWQNNGRLDVYLSSGEKAPKGYFYIKYFKTNTADNRKTYFLLR